MTAVTELNDQSAIPSSAQFSDGFIRRLLKMPSGLFWKNAVSDAESVRTEITRILHESQERKQSILPNQEKELLHLFLRLNAFRMAMHPHMEPSAVDALLLQILPEPQIDSLAAISLIIRKTRNSATAGIIIGGTLASSRSLAKMLPSFGTKWATEMQSSLKRFEHTIRGPQKALDVLPDLRKIIDAAAFSMKAMLAFLSACPFISQYVSPDSVLRGIAFTIANVPTLVETTQTSFRADAMEGMKLVSALQAIRRDALKTAILLCFFVYPNIHPEIVKEADKLLTQRIEATCNNLCAAMIRHREMQFSAWFDVVCSDGNTMESVESLLDYETSKMVCLERIDGIAAQMASDGSKPSGTLSEVVSECISREKKPVEEATQIAPKDPQVSQLKELFPHWNSSAIPKLLERYGNSVETIVEEAFSCNLPPDLQELLDVPEETVEEQPNAQSFSLFTESNKGGAQESVTETGLGKSYDIFQESTPLYAFPGLFAGNVPPSAERLDDDDPEEEVTYLERPKEAIHVSEDNSS